MAAGAGTTETNSRKKVNPQVLTPNSCFVNFNRGRKERLRPECLAENKKRSFLMIESPSFATLNNMTIQEFMLPKLMPKLRHVFEHECLLYPHTRLQNIPPQSHNLPITIPSNNILLKNRCCWAGISLNLYRHTLPPSLGPLLESPFNFITYVKDHVGKVESCASNPIMGFLLKPRTDFTTHILLPTQC